MTGQDLSKTRPCNVAVFLAACVALIGLIGWTGPALWTLVAVAGAVILLDWARRFLTERRELTVDDLTAEEGPDLVHPTTEQQASGAQQVDESADDSGEVVQ